MTVFVRLQVGEEEVTLFPGDTIGSGRECTLRLQQPGVSEQHLRLRLDAQSRLLWIPLGGRTVVDLRIRRQVHRLPVEEGTRIALVPGGTELEVLDVGLPEETLAIEVQTDDDWEGIGHLFGHPAYSVLPTRSGALSLQPIGHQDALWAFVHTDTGYALRRPDDSLTPVRDGNVWKHQGGQRLRARAVPLAEAGVQGTQLGGDAPFQLYYKRGPAQPVFFLMAAAGHHELKDREAELLQMLALADRPLGVSELTEAFFGDLSLKSETRLRKLISNGSSGGLYLRCRKLGISRDALIFRATDDGTPTEDKTGHYWVPQAVRDVVRAGPSFHTS